MPFNESSSEESSDDYYSSSRAAKTKSKSAYSGGASQSSHSRKQPLSCICPNPVECRGVSAVFRVLHDSRSGFVELPPTRMERVVGGDAMAVAFFLRSAYLRNLHVQAPPDNSADSKTNTKNQQIPAESKNPAAEVSLQRQFVALHHFHPTIVEDAEIDPNDPRLHLVCRTIDEASAKALVMNLTERDHVMDASGRPTEEYFVVPNYSFEKVKLDAKKAFNKMKQKQAQRKAAGISEEEALKQEKLEKKKTPKFPPPPALKLPPSSLETLAENVASSTASLAPVVESDKSITASTASTVPTPPPKVPSPPVPPSQPPTPLAPKLANHKEIDVEVVTNEHSSDSTPRAARKTSVVPDDALEQAAAAASLAAEPEKNAKHATGLPLLSPLPGAMSSASSCASSIASSSPSFHDSGAHSFSKSTAKPAVAVTIPATKSSLSSPPKETSPKTKSFDAENATNVIASKTIIDTNNEQVRGDSEKVDTIDDSIIVSASHHSSSGGSFASPSTIVFSDDNKISDYAAAAAASAALTDDESVISNDSTTSGQDRRLSTASSLATDDDETLTLASQQSSGSSTLDTLQPLKTLTNMPRERSEALAFMSAIESKRRCWAMPELETIRVEWTCHRALIRRMVREAKQLEDLMMNSYRALEMYAGLLDAIHNDCLLDDEGNVVAVPRRRKRLADQRQRSNQQPFGPVSTLQSSTDAPSGGIGGSSSHNNITASNHSLLQPILEAIHGSIVKIKENLPQLQTEVNEMKDLRIEIITRSSVLAKKGANIMYNLSFTEAQIQEAWERLENVSTGVITNKRKDDHWLAEASYKNAVKQGMSLWKAQCQDLDQLCRDTIRLDSQRRTRVKEILLSFLPRRRRIFLRILDLITPAATGLELERTGRDEIDQALESELQRFSRESLSNYKRNRSSILNRSRIFKLSVQDDSWIETPPDQNLFKSELVKSVQPLDYKSGNANSSWQLALAVTTVDGSMHLFVCDHEEVTVEELQDPTQMNEVLKESLPVESIYLADCICSRDNEQVEVIVEGDSPLQKVLRRKIYLRFQSAQHARVWMEDYIKDAIVVNV